MAPLPRLRVLSLALVALVVSPIVSAEPLVGGLITGGGAASTFQIFGGAFSVQGGLYQRELVCKSCFARITITEANFILVQDGVLGPLSPGRYELREFTGDISYSMVAPGDYDIHIDGRGRILRIG